MFRLKLMRDSRALKILSIFSTRGPKPLRMSLESAEFSPNTRETCIIPIIIDDMIKIIIIFITCLVPKLTKSSTRSMVFSIMLMLFWRMSAHGLVSPCPQLTCVFGVLFKQHVNLVCVDISGVCRYI